MGRSASTTRWALWGRRVNGSPSMWGVLENPQRLEISASSPDTTRGMAPWQIELFGNGSAKS